MRGDVSAKTCADLSLSCTIISHSSSGSESTGQTLDLKQRGLEELSQNNYNQIQIPRACLSFPALDRRARPTQLFFFFPFFNVVTLGKKIAV